MDNSIASSRAGLQVLRIEPAPDPRAAAAGDDGSDGVVALRDIVIQLPAIGPALAAGAPPAEDWALRAEYELIAELQDWLNTVSLMAGLQGGFHAVAGAVSSGLPASLVGGFVGAVLGAYQGRALAIGDLDALCLSTSAQTFGMLVGALGTAIYFGEDGPDPTGNDYFGGIALGSLGVGLVVSAAHQLVRAYNARQH